ncbi:MAG: WXG100 family type VII secretion target [Bacteroidales bacterium]|nr:WXG100 family type VII secretion target [Bacteroidales bacterium]
MSRVNVDFVDLERFKAILDQNAQHFDEIRRSIGSTIRNIAETDWQDQKSEQFSATFFGQSDPDITKLVETMTQFSAYLQTKIGILQQYHATNINF